MSRDRKGLERILQSDRDLLRRLRQQGMTYAQECSDLGCKGTGTTQVLNWVVRRGVKPDTSAVQNGEGKVWIVTEIGGETEVPREVATGRW